MMRLTQFSSPIMGSRSKGNTKEDVEELAALASVFKDEMIAGDQLSTEFYI